ncbi:microtubule-associated protein futsch-like [Liolophura sinensis]|uniref:microtubule-associated protein futsch-like n=1 Tax=Liolophura sinensis TaxID=3198878 RepID=UPI0031586344
MADSGVQDQDITASSVDSSKLTDNVCSRPLSATSGSPSHKGERGGDTGSGSASVDAAHKKEKEKEREDRIRAVKEKQMLERQRKIEELREAQRLAQEHRNRQQELRRKKIEELRRREEERRAAVDERRRKREEIERARREAILAKTSERLARYEAWKASGKGKGGVQGPFGFGSRTPRDICERLERSRRSASQSAIYRRSPNDSDSDSYIRPQRRAISACSTVRRHCCVDVGSSSGLAPGYTSPSKRLSASTSVLYHKKSPDLSSPGHLNVSMRNIPSANALGTIPENRSFLAPHGSTPHRPRSTVGLHTAGRQAKPVTNPSGPPRASRKPRPASIAGTVPGFVSLNPPTPDSSSRSKSSERLNKEKPRPRPQSMGPERKKREVDDTPKSQTPSAKPNLRRTTISTIERLAVPKYPKGKTETPQSEEKATPKPKTEGNESLDDNASTGTADSTPSKDSLVTSKTLARATTPKPLKEPPTASESNGLVASQNNINKPPSEEEEYKAKLAEKRRQAREKAEREAEEERLKLEEERLKEEERLRQEEEEQRRLEEESMRLAEEARNAEEERLRLAIEAEEQRKKDEAEKAEQERIAKEEADRKAKEEAERLEKERQEKARKDEEERLERKKRLEMIMKRVKTDAPTSESTKGTDSPAKSNQGSPIKSSASAESLGEDRTDEEGSMSPEENTVEESVPAPDDRLQVPEEDSRPKFSSPLLKQLMDKRTDESPGEDRPKFKSPLLQNLLGKSKMARSSSEKSLSDDKSDLEQNGDIQQRSSAQRQLLSGENYDKFNGKSDVNGDKEVLGEPLSSQPDLENAGDTSVPETGSELDKVKSESQYMEEETSPSSGSGETTLINLASEEGMDIKCNGLESHLAVEDNSQALVDSSISMKTDDTGRSLTSSYRDDDLVTSTELGGELASQEAAEEGRIEDIIDLSVTNKNLSFEETTSTTSIRTNTDDLLNFNSLDPEGDAPPKAPFIAFEDNAVKRQDVTSDLLS